METQNLQYRLCLDVDDVPMAVHKLCLDGWTTAHRGILTSPPMGRWEARKEIRSLLVSLAAIRMFARSYSLFLVTEYPLHHEVERVG